MINSNFFSLLILSILFFTNSVAVLHAQITTYSVQEFMAKKSDWRSMKDNIKIEGRISTFNINNLQFINIENEVSFKWASPDIKPGKLYLNAEIYGKLDLIVNQWIFSIQSISEKPTDFEYVKRKASGLPEDKPDPWLELAKWTEDRATYYSNDSILLNKAHDFKETAIHILRKNITTKDGDAIINLARQVKQLGLDDALSESYMHEGLYYKFQEAAKKPATLLDFSKQLQAELRGSLLPQPNPDPQLVEKYEKEPVPQYRLASAENRRILERILYRDTILKYVESLATPNFSTAATQAKLIKQYLPEEITYYEKLLDQDLKYQAEGISSKTRQEAIELAKKFTDRRQEAEGRKLLETWMQARKARTPIDRLNERLDIADDYIKLLNDKDKSRDELLAVALHYPEDKNIAKRLEELGYTNQNGKWVPQKTVTNPTEKPANTSFPGLAEGMSREQVFSEIGGPTSITRAFSQGSLIEVWDYSDHHLSITFFASTQNQLAVKEINNTNPIKAPR